MGAPSSDFLSEPRFLLIRGVSELSSNPREHYVFLHVVFACIAPSPEECLEDFFFFQSAWLELTKFRARILCNERACGHLVRLAE